MTQQEFFVHTQLHPSQVNIWYDDTGASPYTIRAVTIPVLDTSVPPKDLSPLLNNLQQILVPLSTGVNIQLDITSRTTIQTQGVTVPFPVPATKYYYFVVKPLTIASIGNTNIPADNLVFTPSIDVDQFNDSPYNVLQGSLEESRQSSYIMQADRYKIGTLANPTYTGPLNINELLSGSAVKADVQDSNYTTTGWINGRYEGSKTDRIDFKTEPAITGKFFDASEFPSGSTTGQINYLISSSQVVYKPFFYAGVGDTPGFGYEYSGYKLNADYLSGQTDISISPETAGVILTTPRVGDLYRQVGNAEVMKINAVTVVSTSPVIYVIFVTRGYFGSIQNLSAGVPLQRITQVQVYNVEGSKVSGVPRGQVLVKETGAILRLDSLGYVIAST